ncbi:hypothetical protein [Rhodovulum sp. P5]|uniref:hypothetical protein n=1 Tax=Rhodovulum sp. P5 TaxID=1564506 RepID=UPI0012EC117B|nr:hypothetical protein [Rhodovulum sp. P5]
MKPVVASLAISMFMAGSASASPITAYEVQSVFDGNQAYGGILGMLFEVNETVTVLSLGAFDDDGDGIAGTLTTELWSRTGTVGDSILAAMTFTANDYGTLEGGSRFKDLVGPLVLTPGSYAIVSYGYSATDENGNRSSPNWMGSLATNDGNGALSFVRGGRYGGTPGTGIGTTYDPEVLGHGDPYAAGTFTYEVGLTPSVPLPVSLPLLAGGVALIGAFGGRRKS